MPSKHKPDSRSLKEISLKELELDHKERKAQWYAINQRSPRVGRHAEQVQFSQVVAALESLRLVFQRVQQRRSRRSDKDYPLFTQGQLKRWVTRRLNRNGLDVKSDNKTVRNACKLLRLTRGRAKIMKNYSLQEWAWLVKHQTKSYREQARNKVESFIDDSANKLRELHAIRREPNPKGIDLSRLIEWEISHHTKRLARYKQVLTLFHPSPRKTLKLT